MYKPLPDSLTIKKSKIEGLGLFATKDIKQGTDLGFSHVVLDSGNIGRTPLGGFYNHSTKPNCYKFPERGGYKLIAEVNIKAGEELTVSYTFYNPEV